MTDDLLAKNRAAVEPLKAIILPKIARRIEAGKCCAQVRPTGTYTWRFCKNNATGKDEYGKTYCTKHSPYNAERLT